MLLNRGAREVSWEAPGLWEDPTNPKGNWSWIFIGRTDVKNWLIEKDPDTGKDWKREEKGMTEDEMVGWHHRLDGHGFDWALGVGDGHGSLACCSPWGRKELDTTERLNWTELGCQGSPSGGNSISFPAHLLLPKGTKSIASEDKLKWYSLASFILLY